jgi:hypothetical protein
MLLKQAWQMELKNIFPVLAPVFYFVSGKHD